MGYDRLAVFDFDPSKNELLYLERGRPRTRIFLLAGIIAFLIWVTTLVVDPAWNPHYVRGKGAWIVALFVLMPISIRLIAMTLTTGWLAEMSYRTIVRSFDGKPDFVIGPSGVADLDPWRPQAMLWREIKEIRRISTRPGLFTNGKSMGLQFIAAGECPSWLPESLWSALPSSFKERRLGIAPRQVGMEDDDLRRLIERYSGRISLTERTI